MSLTCMESSSREKDGDWLLQEADQFDYNSTNTSKMWSWLFIGLGLFSAIYGIMTANPVLLAAAVGLLVMADSASNYRYISKHNLFQIYNAEKLRWLQTRDEHGLELHEYLLQEGYGKWAEKAREEYGGET